MATITDQNAIDRQAKVIFEMKLVEGDPKWTHRADNPDFHIDYTVETTENGNPTGQRFSVQLKGTTQLQEYSDHISFSMQTKHLAYYLDKHEAPVFLIVVDVKTKRAFWVFIQEYLRVLDHEDWRKQDSFTVKLLKNNDLDNFDEFKVAVEKAHAYMKKLRPGKIIDAVQYAKQELLKLDSRFDANKINVIHENDKTLYNIDSDGMEVKIDIKANSKKQEVEEKLMKCLSTGEPQDFNDDEIQLVGSPVFQREIVGERITTLANCKRSHMDLAISVNNNDKYDLILHGLKVDCYYGSMQCSAVYTNAAMPLGLRLVFKNDNTQSGQISLSLQAWVGKPILKLPYFYAMKKIFDCIVTGGSLLIELQSATFKEQFLMGGITFWREGMLDEFIHKFGFLQVCVDECRSLNINPLLPANLEELKQIIEKSKS